MFSRPWISSSRYILSTLRHVPPNYRYASASAKPKSKSIPVEEAIRELESRSKRLLTVVKKKIDMRVEALKKLEVSNMDESSSPEHIANVVLAKQLEPLHEAWESYGTTKE
ncbi:hypothetical protein M422DRAFT_277091, partial [Sphaerobolus stellatus SS14]